jgi:cytochrome P450
LIPNAVEELLRFEAPSPVQARYATKSVEWHGERIPEGSAVLLLNGSANRDERTFEDPDSFDIHRQIGSHLTATESTSASAATSRGSKAA